MGLKQEGDQSLAGGGRSVSQSVQQVFAGGGTGAVGAPRVRGAVRLPAPLAHVRLRDVALADLGAGQVDPGVALVALDHGPASERLHAETRHQVPRVVV